MIEIISRSAGRRLYRRAGRAARSRRGRQMAAALQACRPSTIDDGSVPRESRAVARRQASRNQAFSPVRKTRPLEFPRNRATRGVPLFGLRRVLRGPGAAPSGLSVGAIIDSGKVAGAAKNSARGAFLSPFARRSSLFPRPSPFPPPCPSPACFPPTRYSSARRYVARRACMRGRLYATAPRFSRVNRAIVVDFRRVPGDGILGSLDIHRRRRHPGKPRRRRSCPPTGAGAPSEGEEEEEEEEEAQHLHREGLRGRPTADTVNRGWRTRAKCRTRQCGARRDLNRLGNCSRYRRIYLSLPSIDADRRRKGRELSLTDVETDPKMSFQALSVSFGTCVIVL
ncbi:hypothetical protein DBV15_09514 [Temnothorax longispinosus]|uniref:Uncharacterized protein n=1 Tax=Temnothorax longispinosus TaxID=300112 RepID=A0A4S2KI02_9HYME|nr:hypothetical protein DBV15_09514 [Temnothorax longispinosus]